MSRHRTENNKCIVLSTTSSSHTHPLTDEDLTGNTMYLFSVQYMLFCKYFSKFQSCLFKIVQKSLFGTLHFKTNFRHIYKNLNIYFVFICELLLAPSIYKLRYHILYYINIMNMLWSFFLLLLFKQYSRSSFKT